MPDDAPPTGAQWITAFAERVGVDPPDQPTIDTLLELASIAAHASERLAAPIACWLLGRAGIAPERALELAREV